jgi:hypothetical protein
MLSTQQRIQQGAQPFTAPLSVPAPLKGWNTRDELDAMDPLDAVQLDNFYPDSEGVYVRTGSQSWATGLGSGAVETLAEFRNASADKLLGACGGSIFDVTAGGAVGAALGSGFSGDRWQTVNFLSHLFLVNGADAPQIFDGTTLANASFSGSDLTATTLNGVFQYQQRLFFWQTASTGFWYAPLNSISGTLVFYDLAPFAPRGGTLVAVTSVTHDGGNGVLDFICFIMSSGDALLFFGNDPSNNNAWQEIGRYRVSPPVNIRAVCQYGGDSFLATFDDYLPLQQQLVALKVGQLPPRSKISGAVQAAIAANAGGFGWQALYYPKGRRLIFNVPNLDGTFAQHVCNTALPSQPWCRFLNLNASCWGLLGNNLFFGGPGGVVYQADVGQTDSGTPISGTAQQAWSTTNSAYRKRMTAVRPIVQSAQGAYTFAIGYDYGALTIPEPTALAGAPLTDDGGNDITDDSGNPITIGIASISTAWRAAGGTGTAYSFGMMVSVAALTSWLRTDCRLEQGTAL